MPEGTATGLPDEFTIVTDAGVEPFIVTVLPFWMVEPALNEAVLK